MLNVHISSSVTLYTRWPTDLSFILFQICRDECEVLEYQLCQKELAIARSQPMISHQLVLPDCKELPVIGWVAKSRSYFFQILHISPILDKITWPLFQEKIILKKFISTKLPGLHCKLYNNPSMFLPHFPTWIWIHTFLLEWFSRSLRPPKPGWWVKYLEFGSEMYLFL